MKHILFIVLLSSLSFSSLLSQQKAVTEDGDEVILYKDGTWKYLNPSLEEISDISTNPNEFEKNDKSTFLLKSSSVDVGFYLDPKIWSFKKAVNNEMAEYELQLKKGDLYGMIITEKVEIPLEMLGKVALENARNVAPDIEVTKQEYRMVNGIKVLCIQMKGTMQGMKLIYHGYYYSYEGGTVQFVTYTSQNLIDEYIGESENLLNGIVGIETKE